MEKPELKKENIDLLWETPYFTVADLRYTGRKHYYSVSRRQPGEIALKSKEEFRQMIGDAVCCFVIVIPEGKEPGLLLTKEFRYTCGQFLLSPPAGLIDAADLECDEPIITAAKREIWEETGLEIKDSDRIFEVNRFCFTSPGMSDESNSIICAIVNAPADVSFHSDFTEQTELIGDYKLYSREEAMELIKKGSDEDGIFYSAFTWMCMMYFVSGLWEE